MIYDGSKYLSLINKLYIYLKKKGINNLIIMY